MDSIHLLRNLEKEISVKTSMDSMDLLRYDLLRFLEKEISFMTSMGSGSIEAS